eukprot:907147-Pleurochrysis_carterae.AAC.1
MSYIAQVAPTTPLPCACHWYCGIARMCGYIAVGMLPSCSDYVGQLHADSAPFAKLRPRHVYIAAS